MEKLGIYIHNPYCLKKCRYCDFDSSAKAPESSYYDRLCLQIAELSAKYNAKDRFEVDSIFFGGGTPTLTDTGLLQKVLESISNHFTIASDCEITTEANPETVSAEKLNELKSAGFNRISVGVQSFDDSILSAIGRVHNAKKAEEACGLITESFENFNIDLMIGLPEQSFDSFADSLKKALSYHPKHLSFYSLQLEEGTPLYEDYKNGICSLPEWTENRRMYRYTVETLKQNGYHHYEVSNAAMPGFECRHNLKYWHMQPYLGFGNSSHSFIDGKRFSIENDKIIQEQNNQDDLKGDFIFTELRLIDGFSLSDYREMFGSEFTCEHREALVELIGCGMMEISNNRVKLTEKGLDNTNPVMERLLND